MFLSHRSIALAGSPAYLATDAIVHSRYRIHAVSRRAVVSDDELLLKGFSRRGGLGRPVVTVVLEGAARIRWNDDVKWLAPGELAMEPDKDGIAMRQEGDRYRSVVLEWDEGALGDRPDPKLGVQRFTASRALLDACDAFSRALQAAADAIAPSHIEALWDALRDAGVPLRPARAEALVESVSDPIRELAAALDTALSAPGGMLVDLETKLGLSTRQLNRLVKSFNERYAFNAEGWRDLRNRYRVMMAAALLTAEDATVDGVARAVGFTSASTLSRALTNLGLPRPSEIRDATKALGRASV